MEVVGDYRTQGYAHIRGLIPREVARAFMASIKDDLVPEAIALNDADPHPRVLRRPAYEFHGHRYKPMSMFLWGLTPIVSQLVGKELLPTYDYFRIYREGDICKVHSDRPSCEHSLSLTLDYSDGEIWDLQVGHRHEKDGHLLDDDFGEDAYTSVAMEPGDAVLYQGVHHAHGRITPNPNAWSAHLFLHFVDRDGPFRDHAFDKRVNLDPVNFSFA